MKIEGPNETAIIIDSHVNVLPLAILQPVANLNHQWVALALRPDDSADVDLHRLIHLFNGIGLFDTLGPLPLLLPVGATAQLESRLLDECSAQHVLLRVPVEFCVDPVFKERLRQLQAKGFRFLLDGLPPDIGSMYDGALGFRLDCRDGLPARVSQWLCQNHGPHLAEGVADMARFEQCRSAGFGWFAGGYLLHPSVNSSRDDGTTRSRLLKLLGLVAQDAPSCELEVLLKQDPALSYQLLKLVNSAAFPHPHQITSFGQALNLLGRRQLQRWLQLLLYARQHASGTWNPLLPYAALRGRMMEALCELRGGGKEEQDRAFMTGIFSLLDALFGTPMAELIQPLALANDISAALLGRSGDLGRLLALAEKSTSDRGGAMRTELDACAIGAEAYWDGLLQAFGWAMHVSREM